LFNKILGEEEEKKTENLELENKEEKTKKKLEPPDVNQNIDQAIVAFNAKNYGDTRFSIRQAIVGIEMQLGFEVLKEFPDTMNGLLYDPEEDEVISSGLGFVGLLISRDYTDGTNLIEARIANNTAMISSTNYYLSNPTFVSSSDENYKVVRVNGQRALLEYVYDEQYKLSLPFGQSSILYLHCFSCNSEEDIVSAMEAVDVEKIKNILGEQ